MDRNQAISHLKEISARGVGRRDGSIVSADVDLPPELCGAISRHLNTRNIRPLCGHQVAEHIHDLKNGSFSNCYDPIVFRADWTLMNGQHRCAAGERSGVGLNGVVVVLNADQESRRSIDCGRKRTISQTHGVPNDVAAAAGMVLCFERRKPTNWPRSALATRYEANIEVFDHYAQTFRRRSVLRESHLSACFVFAECNKPRSSVMLRDLADDMAVGSQAEHASKLIATHIVKRRQAGVRVNSQRERYDEALLFLRAMQTHLLGAEDSSLGLPCDLDWWVNL